MSYWKVKRLMSPFITESKGRKRWLKKRSDYLKLGIKNNQIARLNVRIRTLEAGIEQEAAYCDKWQTEAVNARDVDRADRHRLRAVRLRALLKGE